MRNKATKEANRTNEKYHKRDPDVPKTFAITSDEYAETSMKPGNLKDSRKKELEILSWLTKL